MLSQSGRQLLGNLGFFGGRGVCGHIHDSIEYVDIAEYK